MRNKPVLLGAGFLLLYFTAIVSGRHASRDCHLRMCDSSEEELNSERKFGPKKTAIVPPVLPPLIPPLLPILPPWRENPSKPADKNSVKVRFFLYNNANNPEQSTEIIAGNLRSILSANPFPSDNITEWKILIPGFPIIDKSPFPENVRQAYMNRMKNFPEERYNVLVVDWGLCACILNTNFENTTYTEVVGEKVAEMLLFLEDNGILSLRMDTHMIGFSIGAHVLGEATRFIFRKFNKQNLLNRATVLDAAGPLFWPNKWSKMPIAKVSRIRRSFVQFLDAIHTSKALGMGGKKIGDIDFFPNGGDKQPGCRKGILGTSKVRGFEDLCSHVFATELFAKSIDGRRMEGCTGYDYYDLYLKNRGNCEDTPPLGEFVDEEKVDGFPLAVGVAYLETGNLNDFGSRFESRLENAPPPSPVNCKWCQLCYV